MFGVGEGELGTELCLLPKNLSGSGEVDSVGTFRYDERILGIIQSSYLEDMLE